MTKIWAFIKAHARFIEIAVPVVVVAVVFALAIREHQARTQADATIKAAQSQIADLQKQQTAVASVAAVKVSVLRKQAAAVDTPAKAVQVLTVPTLAQKAALDTTPLDIKPLPNMPGSVSVDALPLYQTLNVCKQNTVNLDACTLELGLQKQIDGQKDIEITALKAKPKFWGRVLKVAKVTACAGLGGAAGGYIKGGEGAAIGAAAGAGACQLF